MIYICVPAHNEEQTVGVVLWKVRQVMAELARDYQLLVADDGSSDRTPSVLDPYTRVLPLTVLRNESRRGYAAALEMLLREAVRRSEYPRRDTLVVLQADFSEDPQHVATLIRRIESGADIVASNVVYGETQPRLAYRWGRALLNWLLRRFIWPEGARDPLTGLNAYRVVCVKRGLEERTGGRLLQHEGWVANAELLREAVPHARRIDTVDLELRRERLQRDERFHFGSVFREVLAFVRRRPTATLRADQLEPDAIIGGRSQLRALTVELLREDGLANGAGAEPRQRRRGGERGPGRPEKREEGGRGDRSRGERSRPTSGRAPKEKRDSAGARGGKRPRASQTTEPVSGVVEGMAPLNGGEPGAEQGGAGTERRPRPRRRGRRTGTKDRQRAAPGGAAEGTPQVAEAEVASSADAAPAAEAAGEGGDDQGSRKRRRGSRGGRRRGRAPRAPASETENERTNESPPPSDAAAG